MKKILYLLFFIIIVWGGFYFLNPVRKISSYDECVAHPKSFIDEANPYKCKTALDKWFVGDEAMAQERGRPKNQRVCPDAWFDNKMPVVGEPPLETQYFVVQSERWEYDELDVDWVKDNCDINQPMRIF